MTIHRVELPATGIEELRAEAFTEGFDFIERLIKEWSSGRIDSTRRERFFVAIWIRDESSRWEASIATRL